MRILLLLGVVACYATNFNAVIAKNTDNCITRIVTPDSLSAKTFGALVNATNFRAKWLHKFDVTETKPRPFNVNGVLKNVPTMHMVGAIGYGKLPEIKASYVVLPYMCNSAAQKMNMYIILPDDVGGFEQLKNNLNKITVKQLNKNSDSDRVVDLYLPKFNIKSSITIQVLLPKDENLTRSNLIDAFNDSADLSEITGSKELRVVKTRQKARIDVNEEGTEAAATIDEDLNCSTKLAKKSGGDNEKRLPIVKFTADRPFVSVIATKKGAALFGAFTVDPHAQ